MEIKEDRHNYGIDLLRIVAMLMIVAHHFSVHSGISYDTNSSAGVVMAVMSLGGKTGVNIFVLITGYFSSGKIRREKIGNLIGCATFYSLVLTMFAVLAGCIGVSKKLLIKASIPLLFGDTYWFVVTYLELYILIPVLNTVVQRLEQRTYRNYLSLFTCLLCILPTVVGKFIHVNDLGYNALVWFVYLYFLGAYLKKYEIHWKTARYISICCVAAQIAACVLLLRTPIKGVIRLVLECVTDMRVNALLPLMIALTMFLGFQNMKITRGQKMVRFLGSSTLGVYLFHDNVNFRVWLWPEVYQWTSGMGLNSFEVNAIVSVVFVFALGSVVEICRKMIVERIQKIIKSERIR